MIASSPDRLRRIAAQHILALEDVNASEESVLAAIAWLEADEEHYALAAEIAHFSWACDRMPAECVPSAPAETEPQGAGSWLGGRAQWAIAAVLTLAMIGMAALVMQTGLLTPKTSQSTAEYFTDVGESKTVTLPDSTRVALGAASGIRVTYDDAFRRITLTSGEAFFDVAKEKDRPLIVSTDDGAVTALGTAFNVNRRPGATIVTLLRGSVKVAAGTAGQGAATVLRPDTQVEFRRTGSLSPVRAVAGTAAVSWREGSYRYEDAPLSTILADLRRYHRTPIVLDTPGLGDRRFTGVVNLTGGDIEQWLMGLQMLGEIKVTIRDDMVLVSKP